MVGGIRARWTLVVRPLGIRGSHAYESRGHYGGGGCLNDVMGQQAPEQSTTRNRSPGQVSLVIKGKAVLLQMLDLALPGI